MTEPEQTETLDPQGVTEAREPTLLQRLSDQGQLPEQGATQLPAELLNQVLDESATDGDDTGPVVPGNSLDQRKGQHLCQLVQLIDLNRIYFTVQDAEAWTQHVLAHPEYQLAVVLDPTGVLRPPRRGELLIVAETLSEPPPLGVVHPGLLPLWEVMVGTKLPGPSVSVIDLHLHVNATLLAELGDSE